MMTHPQLRSKLDAVGYGVFIPVFFVASGVQYDLGALSDRETLVRIPISWPRGRGPRAPRRCSTARSSSARACRSPGSAGDVAAVHRRRHRDRPRARRRQLRHHAALIAAGLLSLVLFPTSRSCCSSGSTMRRAERAEDGRVELADRQRAERRRWSGASDAGTRAVRQSQMGSKRRRSVSSAAFEIAVTLRRPSADAGLRGVPASDAPDIGRAALACRSASSTRHPQRVARRGRIALEQHEREGREQHQGEQPGRDQRRWWRS
jgi:hypothetical protein